MLKHNTPYWHKYQFARILIFPSHSGLVGHPQGYLRLTANRQIGIRRRQIIPDRAEESLRITNRRRGIGGAKGLGVNGTEGTEYDGDDQDGEER